MAYITISNSKKIIRRLDENLFANVTEAIYKRDIYCFSKREDANLKGIRELFKDLENFIKVYYKPIVVVDSYQYVVPENQPAYHKNNTCVRLTAKFLNIEIPELIRERGTEAVIDFRKWYNSMNFKTDDATDYVIKLTLKYPELGAINPKSIEYNNSGVETKTDYSLSELESEIDGLLAKADNYFNDNMNIRDLIYKYQKLTFLGYIDGALKNNHSGLNDQDLKTFLKSYEETFKTPLKNYLIEYYRIRFNPEMEFKGTLLDKLGFRPCGACIQ